LFYVEQDRLCIDRPREDEDAALGAANYVYTMHEGMIKTEENSEEIKNSSDIREAYLGI
jgi:ABC-type branched-subunit amino acid transport system ATPase component